MLGGEKDFKTEGLNGPLMDVIKRSILEILASTPTLWICSKCKSKSDHVAMLSEGETCTDCVTPLEATSARKTYRTPEACVSALHLANYRVMAEHLLNPH